MNDLSCCKWPGNQGETSTGNVGTAHPLGVRGNKNKERLGVILVLPCLLKTISCSLEDRSWSWPDPVHAEALRNGGKQGGFCGFSPSRAAVQRGSDSPMETGASAAGEDWAPSTGHNPLGSGSASGTARLLLGKAGLCCAQREAHGARAGKGPLETLAPT